MNDCDCLFCGIDVSKATLDLALTIDSKNILSLKRFDNNFKGFVLIHKHLEKFKAKFGCTNVSVCLESTGIYSDGVFTYLKKNSDFKVSVINPFQSKSFTKSIMLRTKTDKIDAEMLAVYAYTIKPPETSLKTEEFYLFQKLVRFYETLKKLRANEKIMLESAVIPFIKNIIEDNIVNYDLQIKKVADEIKRLVNKNVDLTNKVRLLTSIKGIGEITAWIILCEMILEDQNNKINVKSQVAHAGLAPGQNQSGSSIRGKSKICKTGNSRLRKSLYMPAMCAIVSNPVIKKFYDRLVSKGKPKKVALIAASRKLLTICIGVLNNNTAFDPEWNNKIQKDFTLAS